MSGTSPLKDEIIVYRKRREPSFGIVFSTEGDKVKVFTEDGKELEIDINKIVLFTKSKIGSQLVHSEKKLELRKLRKELEENKKTVDIKTLWECISGVHDQISFNELSDLYYNGKNKMEDLQLFWAIEKDDTYFKRNGDVYSSQSEKEVFDAIQRKEAQKKKLEERKKALNWLRTVGSGKPADNNEFNPDGLIEQIRKYVIYLENYNYSSEIKSLLSEAGINDLEGAIEFLIKIGAWNENNDPIFMRYGIEEKFPDKTNSEVVKLLELKGQRLSNEYQNLTSLKVYSIDDKNTFDIDDALSITEDDGKGYEVGIHISNVADTVPIESELDKEAEARAESVYLPDNSIHMSPKELIEELSLFEGCDRHAISLFVNFDNSFNIKSYRFIKSIINVDKNLSYSEAEENLCNRKLGSKLFEIASSLRKKRMNENAFSVDLPHLKFNIDNKEVLSVERYYMTSTAHRMVSEFMILTNSLTAKHFLEKGIPAIYRSQVEGIAQDAFSLDHEDLLYPLKVIKYLRPSKLGTTPNRHCSLGVNQYVQVTSPIRRYLDLVLQRQLSVSIEGNKVPYSENYLETLYKKVEISIRDKRIVEKSRERYWLYTYLKKYELKEIEGVISSVSDNRFSIYIPEYLIELPVNHSSEEPVEGSKVRIKIDSVDILRRKIQYSFKFC